MDGSSHMLTAPASIRQLLGSERDAHRRQRELVRASLVLCPDKPAGTPTR